MTEDTGTPVDADQAARGSAAPASVNPLDLLRGRPLARRLSLAATYAVLTALLANTVAGRISTARTALTRFGRILPEELALFGPDPLTLALIALGLVAFFLAAGTFLVSRDTGSAFALLVVGTVGWFLFPFSEVPWTAVLTGQEAQLVRPPTAAWLLGALMVTVATAEVLLSARTTLVAELDRRDLPDPMVQAAKQRSLIASLTLLGGGLIGGGLLAVLYVASRDALTRGFLADPDLIWVPAIAGLVAGGLIWLVSRRA